MTGNRGWYGINANKLVEGEIKPQKWYSFNVVKEFKVSKVQKLELKSYFWNQHLIPGNKISFKNIQIKVDGFKR